MIKFSILVPAYNASRFILDNIKSVTSQSYKNWEMIIVNDGSTDDTPRIVEKYISQNPNFDIKLVSIKNGGLANARNVALEEATGNYFCNLDADDFLENNILEAIAQALTEDDVDIIYSNIMDFDESTGKKTNYSDRFIKPQNILNGIDAAILKLKRSIWICQGVAFYKLDYISKIHLKNHKGINQGEDMFFITSALAFARSVKYLDTPGVSIRYRDNSMMHAPFNESFLQCITAIDLLKKQLRHAEVSRDKLQEIKVLIDRERIYQELRIAKSICDLWQVNNSLSNTLLLLKKYSYINSPLTPEVKQIMSRSHRLQYFLNKHIPLLFILFTKLHRIIK